MYGFSVQSNGMPRTRLSADRHGSSRYSTRMLSIIEHMFDPSSGRVYSSRDFAWTTIYPDESRPGAPCPLRPAAAERVLRRGRVRARHVPSHADPGARARGQQAGPRGSADHERPAALHLLDAARRHDLVARHRRTRRAGAQRALRQGHGQLPGGDSGATDRHVPACGDRRARPEGDRAQQPRARGARRLAGRCGCSFSRSVR